MSFVKSQILKKLADNVPTYLKSDLSKCLDLVFDEIIKTVAKDKNVEIRGFGSFKIRHLKPRLGINPKNLSRVDIPAKKSVRWKMSKELFQKLNQDVNYNE